MYKIGILLLFMLSSCGMMKKATTEEYSISKEDIESGCDVNIRPYFEAKNPGVFE